MEVGIKIQKGMDNIKKDLKDDIFQEIGVNLQRGLGNIKREINDRLQQSLVVMTQNHEENINETLNAIKGQGNQKSCDIPPQKNKYFWIRKLWGKLLCFDKFEFGFFSHLWKSWILNLVNCN